MHDFHLRYMQMYIQGRQTAIEPGYNFLSFLQDFSRFYATVPGKERIHSFPCHDPVMIVAIFFISNVDYTVCT